MNIQPTVEQAISDDQELAKALAGVTDQPMDDDIASLAMPDPIAPPMPMPMPPVAPATDDSQADSSDDSTFIEPPFPMTTPATDRSSVPAPVADPALDSIKQEAINELRPLVDKLQVSPEEKFDTYLLLLRSTDDRDLISPAHEAAKAITDETKKAQALLDIIKEIDFFSQPQQ